MDLHFPLGLEVTARNLKGVTVKDALDAIHKQFKKKVRRPQLLLKALANCVHRLMTSWRPRSLPVSSGTKRSAVS